MPAVKDQHVTIADDQSRSPDNLSATSQKMLSLRDKVFLEWEKRVRREVSQAGALKRPVLIDTLPIFYVHMAESVTPDFPRTDAVSTTTIAAEHGGERARLTHYDPKAIILEYQALKEAMLDVFKLNGVRLHDDELRVVTASIDGAIREAVNAYVIQAAVLREQFMAALMHDLKNPLSSASMGALLISRTTDSPKTKGIADMIIKNQHRIGEMIHQLLDAMVFQNGGRLRLDLSNFDILELVKDVCRQAEADHGPRFRIIGEAASVVWSKEEIKRALENLIGNAVKYGAVDTTISVKLDLIDERMALSVHNEGNPIPPEEIDDIFRIFERARSARDGKKEGWGLGLPFIRAVAESHGGSSVVDSSAERGTTFTIDMPLDARPFQDTPTN
jgi:signal transduction histidine kinase